MRISDWSSDVCSSDLLRLLRDGNAMTRADQASEVVFRRMHRHATHRNRPPLMFPTRGERNIERRGSLLRIVEEQLEKVAHAINQQAIVDRTRVVQGKSV